jgi:hypothetical protein
MESSVGRKILQEIGGLPVCGSVGGRGVERVYLERGGWDSTTDTSERAALYWPPAGGAWGCVRLTGLDDMGVQVWVA